MSEPRPRVRSAQQATKHTFEMHLSVAYSWPRVIGIALLVVVAAAFYISPVHYLSDSGFSLMMDEAIIHEWTPDMLSYQVPRGHGTLFINDGYPWNIKIIRGRLLYVYPWGSSLLSLPLVAMLNAAGLRLAPHHKYNGYKELSAQAIITTALSAITILVIYEAAGYLLSLPAALAVTLGAAFGSPIWSSASRSLWPQTWAMLLTTIAIWILLSGSIRPFLLATVLAWSCLVRPQIIPDVAVITGYVLVRYDRQFFWRYLAAGALSTIPICAMTWHFTGGLFSALYSPGMLDFPHKFWLRLYGVLLSPSRGFLVFTPVAFVPLYLTIRYWKALPERRLAIVAIVIIAMHLMMLSSWITWWGGGSYGPRLLLEVVPWFVLLAILGIKAFEEDGSLSRPKRLVTASIGWVLLAASITTNAPGALAANAIGWKNLDGNHLDALWDWHDPQFLCWIERLQK